jgi:4-diphosphocytidyl-2-C-methyl-D-erythritol kinase
LLGSDVPFFVHETPAARVTGRGEIVEPVDLPRCFFVLVNSGFPSSTADAFRLLDNRVVRKREPSVRQFSASSCFPYELNFEVFFNDFLDVFLEPEKTVYNDIIYRLRELGADFAGLSGAGSTCFGIFRDRAQAEKAAAFMRKKWRFVECTHSSC